jgi:hypothetical protein
MTTLNSDPEIVVTDDSNTASKKAPKVKYNYPFATKKQILAQLDSDPAFLFACFDYLQGCQEAPEQERSATIFSNKSGWMSSHAANAAKLAVKKAEGTLDADDVEKMHAMVGRYTKQLAAKARRDAIAENPELAVIAEIFSAN